MSKKNHPFFFSLLILVTCLSSAFGAGYTCDSYKKYTSCNSGYYMAGSSGTNCVNTPAVGNKCLSCLTMGSNYKCTGGTACPQLNQVDCPAGQYLPANSTTCKACLDKYYCPGGKHTANYNADQGLNKCPDGTDGSDSNRSALAHCYKNCPTKSISGGTTAKVKEKVQYDGSKYPTCTYTVSCNAGYGASGNSSADPKCTQCSAGQYGAGGTNSCSQCPAGYPLSAAGNTSQNTCYKNVTVAGRQLDGAKPANCASVAEWNACSPTDCTYKDYYNSTDGTCTPKDCTKTVKSVNAGAGYYVNGTVCAACESGYYCPGGKYTVGSSIQGRNICPAGYSGSNSTKSAITHCYKNCSTKSIDGGTATLTSNIVQYNATSSSYPACTYTVSCNAGYGASGNSTADPKCTKCESGKYSAGKTATCESCPAGKYNTTAGASSCNDCGADYYCSGGSVHTSCGAGKTTNGKTTASQASECICSAGYGFANNACTACTNGTYKGTAGNSACTSCPANSTTTNTGNTAQSACQCNAGYTGNASITNGTCSACEKGKYKTSIGNDSCTACIANSSTSGTGSTAKTDCQCNAGYSGNAGTGTCTACIAGTYKTSMANTTCTTCPEHSTTSGTGKTVKTDCICNAGYGGNAGTGSCTACTTGKYKASNGNGDCTPASTGHYVSGTGQTSQSACAAGSYTNTTGQSSCTKCDGAKYQNQTGQTSCINCPTADNGWTAGQGTGWTAVTNCYETQKPANCSSGTIKKVATSATAWGTAAVDTTLTANTGYYVSNTSCVACSNGPANSTYTSNGGSSNSCSWNCNNGYGKTFESKCVLKCTAGISTLHAGTNVSVQLYDARSTTPSIVIQKGDKMCYGNLTADSAKNAINVQYNGKTYHSVN